MKESLIDLMHQVNMLDYNIIDIDTNEIVDICKKHHIIIDENREPYKTTIIIRDKTNGNSIMEQYTIAQERELRYANIIYKDFVIHNLLIQIIALRFKL